LALVRRIEGTQATRVDGGWQCAALAPGEAGDPSRLEGSGARWFDAAVPGTAASALAAAKAWSEDESRDFDAQDWWFRCVLRPGQVPGGGARAVLRFDGLASLADVWIDGAHVLRSESMFLPAQVDATERLRGKDAVELAVRFGSLQEALKAKRPRPRYRTQLVAAQQLRWLRTSLLGRIPAWTPPAAPVGPYAPVWLEMREHLEVVAADVRARVEGTDGVCEATLRLRSLGEPVTRATIAVAGARAELACEAAADGVVVARGTVRVRDVARWWPFTHGQPALHEVRAHVRVGDREIAVDLGRTGFRSIECDEAGGGFGLRVNGVDVFCRGGCWFPLDVVSLQADARALGGALAAVRAAGMNVLRVGGTTIYESQAFHDACDEMGILVWQDLMFANMDYPVGDAGFSKLVEAEVAACADRLQLSPSFAVLCGNSEVQQQAAMLGLARDGWSNEFFDSAAPSIARAAIPGLVYVPSTPAGGALPFRVDTGISHYYGVGAYMRPPEDARRAGVRFTPECLAFANLPCDETIEELLEGAVPPTHPRWKRRIPRDGGAPWDFEDVRDHYVRQFFHVDPAELRAGDLARYLQLGRVATGEAMAGAMAEWRRAGSACRGAIVWTLRDLWRGAGWGVIDACGRPKAAYYFLKRVLQPVALLAVDEGLNGLSLHAVNDGPQPLDARIRLVLYRQGSVSVAEASEPVAVPAHGAVELRADALLGRFVDTTYAYRFGPPGHDVVVATLIDAASGARLGQAFHYPCGRARERYGDLGLEASGERVDADAWRITVRTKRVAQCVAFDARGFVVDDDFFDVEPGGEHTVIARGAGPLSRIRLLPLNAIAATSVQPK
jgi:beta-mannosidase